MRLFGVRAGLGILITLIGGCAASSLPGSSAAREGIRVYAVQESAPEVIAKNRAIEQTLTKMLPEVRIEDPTLNSVIEWLGEFAGIAIVVQWDELKECGIERNKPISGPTSLMPLRQALERLLSEAGSGSAKLTYVVRAGALEISTADRLSHRPVVRVYDVRSLLAAAEAWNDRAAEHAARRAKLAAGGGCYSGCDNRDTHLGRQYDYGAENALLDLFMQIVEPDEWRQNGGNGSAYCFNGLLVVRQPESVQHELAAFLRTLHEAGASQPP
jgi:hypothetical protein